MPPSWAVPAHAAARTVAPTVCCAPNNPDRMYIFLSSFYPSQIYLEIAADLQYRPKDPPTASQIPSQSSLEPGRESSVPKRQEVVRRSTRTPLNPPVSAEFAIAAVQGHSFLCAEGLKSIPPEDVTFLWSKGSLRIPDREACAEFLDLYFKKVHPLLPLVDEAQVWRIFDGHGDKKLSLFVFQSILFAACQVWE